MDDTTPRMHSGPIHPRQRTIFWDRRTTAESREVYELELCCLEFPERTVFLEHVHDLATSNGTAQVIAASTSHILLSEDGAMSWRSVQSPIEQQFSRCFTLRSGRRLLMTDGDASLHVFDESWRYLGRRDAGRHGWHGTWSIDQSTTGTIMFGEYGDAADCWRVYRSTDDGESWKIAFQASGNALQHQAGEIRHFHTCQADPFAEGVWWLSSGDTATQNRIWRSGDDGVSWLEVTVETNNFHGHVAEQRRDNIKRHTAELFTPSFIYWATDDNLGNRAQFVRMTRSSGASSQVERLTVLGRNEMRNLIQLDGSTLLAISESKHDPTRAQVFVLDLEGSVKSCFDLPNLEQARSGFCRSRSSKAAADGIFFSFTDARVLERDHNFLIWKVHGRSRGSGEERRRALLARIDEVGRTYGSNDTEAAFLARRYAAHFQCNLCNEALEPVFASDEYGRYEGILDPSRFKDSACHEYTCPHCDSRIRQRTARLVLERHASGGRAVLAASESLRQIKWFKQRYDSVVHVALHGDFGDPEILSGTDVTNMPHIPSNHFDFYWASCVLDYIPKLNDAAREAFRVLAPGGQFVFFIMPYRLADDNTTCVIKHHNALAHEKYAQRASSETGIPDCKFGVRYILNVFADAGFSIRRLPVFDQMSQTQQAWFIGTKPAS